MKHTLSNHSLIIIIFFILLKGSYNKLFPNTINDTITKLVTKANEYITNENYDSAFNYLNNALNTAENYSNRTLIANILKDIGTTFGKRNLHAQAESYYKRALQIAQEQNDSSLLSSLYNNLGNCYYSKGDYVLAIDYYLKSLEIERFTQNNKGVANCYLNIGNIYLVRKEYDEALDYYNKCLEFFLLDNDKLMAASAQSSIGSIYRKKKNFDKAFEFYNNSLETFNELNNKKGLITAYMNLGHLMNNMGKKEKVLEYYNLGKSIAKELDDDYMYASVQFNIGNYFYNSGNYTSSIDHFKQAYNLSKKHNYLHLLRNSSKKLSDAYAKIKKYESAYEFHQLFKEYNDKSVNESQIKKLTQLEMQYKFDQEQKELEYEHKQKEIIQQSKISQQKLFIRVWIAIFIIFLILIVLIFITYRARQKAKNHELISNMNLYAQQVLNLKMNPHFIFNTLNSIRNFILKNDTKSSDKYLTRFAKLIRMTLENSMNPFVQLKKEIDIIDTYLELEKLRLKDKFIYEISIDNKINVDQIMIPSLLLQPFIENSIIHGIFPLKKTGKINIVFELTEHNVICKIEDNGIGRMKSGELHDNKNQHHSLGIEITQKRLNILKSLYKDSSASLNIIDLKNQENETEGTLVELNIPIIT